MRHTKIVLGILLSFTATVAFGGSFTIHYPTNQVYTTGTPSSGDKAMPAPVHFEVYQVVDLPWDSKTFVNPPYPPGGIGGWNLSLYWGYKYPGTTAIAYGESAYETISRNVTVL